MKQYQDLIRQILINGEVRKDRTGVGTRSVFGTFSKYDLRDGFPLVTLKKTLIKSIIEELLWFLRGETNIKTLKCHIWDEWANEDGELGPIYSAQWRNALWSTSNGKTFTVDQIQELITSLKQNPYSRRHIVSSWNVGQINEMALPPCHTMFQCYVSNDGYLDLTLYQRSGDVCLGVPYNIASYSILLMLLAREAGSTPRFFNHMIGDAHIYENHLDCAKTLVLRTPYSPPLLTIADKPINELTADDFSLKGYQSYPFWKLEVAV